MNYSEKAQQFLRDHVLPYFKPKKLQADASRETNPPNQQVNRPGQLTHHRLGIDASDLERGREQGQRFS